MGLAKKRARNVNATKLKLSKIKALKFKKTASKPVTDVEMVQENIQDIDVDVSVIETKKLGKKLKKKQALRIQKKEELRKCVAAKKLKSLLSSTDAMEGAPLDDQVIEEVTVGTEKVNNERVKKHALPIMLPSKPSQLKVCEKQLKVSNVISGRRMSKKKARKMLNALKRDERETERKGKSMDTS